MVSKKKTRGCLKHNVGGGKDAYEARRTIQGKYRKQKRGFIVLKKLKISS